MTEVGIIGAGPAGLAAARYLASEGFEPVLFEQGATIGGQWSGDRARSGIWPSMRTNTSRILTAFSDLPHPNGPQVYPSNQAIGDYLRAYAARFSLMSRVHLRTPVIGLERGVGSRRWLVRTSSTEREFAHVIVATGVSQIGKEIHGALDGWQMAQVGAASQPRWALFRAGSPCDRGVNWDGHANSEDGRAHWETDRDASQTLALRGRHPRA